MKTIKQLYTRDMTKTTKLTMQQVTIKIQFTFTIVYSTQLHNTPYSNLPDPILISDYVNYA